MSKKSTFPPVSRARSSKNLRWNAKARFAMGHDYASRSLIEHRFSDKLPKPPQRVRVYRSESFSSTAEERILSDAQFLLDTGKATNLEDAVRSVIAQRNDNE